MPRNALCELSIKTCAVVPANYILAIIYKWSLDMVNSFNHNLKVKSEWSDSDFEEQLLLLSPLQLSPTMCTRCYIPNLFKIALVNTCYALICNKHKCRSQIRRSMLNNLFPLLYWSVLMTLLCMFFLDCSNTSSS